MRTSSRYRLAAAIVAFAAVVAVVMAEVHASRRADDWVQHSLRVKVALGAYRTELVDAETSARGYLITGDPVYLEPYRRARLADREHEVAALVADNPAALENLAVVSKLAGQRMDELRLLVDLAGRDPAAAIERMSSDRGLALMDDFREELGRMDHEEDRLFEERRTEVRRAFARTLVTLVAASVVLGLTLLYLVQSRRDLERVRADAEAAFERARTTEFNDRFLAVLGHDIKNPLMAIRISVERMEKRLGELGEPHLARIHRSLDRMGRMIDQLLDLSRMRLGGGIPLTPRSVDAADIVRDAVDEMRGVHPRRTVQLVVSGETAADLDPDRFAQVTENLVGNALTHGVPGIPVRVVLEGRPKELVLRVENAGEMPDAARRTLFDPFQRDLHEPSKTSSSAGLGLGLAIVRHVVGQHGGRIEVDGDGITVFTVHLPRASALG